MTERTAGLLSQVLKKMRPMLVRVVFFHQPICTRRGSSPNKRDILFMRFFRQTNQILHVRACCSQNQNSLTCFCSPVIHFVRRIYFMETKTTLTMSTLKNFASIPTLETGLYFGASISLYINHVVSLLYFDFTFLFFTFFSFSIFSFTSGLWPRV